MIAIPIRIGILSALYIILFDLFILTLLNYVLSRLLSVVYYRKLFSGQPLRVQSTDIPGVTRFLVGPWYTLPNMLAIAVKLLFIATIFSMFLNISTSSRSVYRPRRYIASYKMINSNVARAGETSRDLTIPTLPFRIQACRRVNGENITYYQVAFNPSDDDNFLGDISSKRMSQVPADKHSILCLSPEYVKEPKESAVVVGCSILGRTKQDKCGNEAPVLKNADILDFRTLPFKGKHVQFWDPNGRQHYHFQLHLVHESSIRSIFPEYTSSDYGPETTMDMMCLQTKIGTSSFLTECHLYIIRNGETLIERWIYNVDSRQLSRKFAGPIFKGELDFDMILKATIIWSMFSIPSCDWRAMSSTIAAKASTFSFENRTSQIIDSNYSVTEVPNNSLIVIVFILAIIISSAIIVSLALDRMDKRPPLNSINGLSSIAREEQTPSGASDVMGSTMSVGLTLQEDNMLRFGPLKNLEDAVALKQTKNGIMM